MTMAYPVILLLVVAVHSVPLPNETHDECGYQNCPEIDTTVLNVHIVAHTHDDVGWLKTVDQYYYGSRNNIQKAGVQYILDSVVKELWEDPKRKFIYVETAFFWKWWVQQSEKVQAQVKILVAEARLQFVGGAWSMNDEAAVHYQSTIDQFTWGLSKINATFGPCALPRVGWQIDPFGHSREFASLLAGMGYDGLFLGRIDFQDKKTRLARKSMEMLWRGDDDLGKPSDIFTGVLYNTYSPPPGFCFDVLCNDEPIIDDIDSPMYNVDDKVDIFISYVKNQARHYRTKNVIITMGGDFTYQDASMWYRNLDKLIQYTNLKAAKDKLNIKLFYSTPNCYLKAVKDANPTLPIKQDDFFPYASDPNSYWTGYFTSRPTTKWFERQGNAYLQMAKQLQVLAGLERHNQFMLNSLKSAMGVMQHHDAITGTEKQHVTHDYERILNNAIEDSLIIPRQAFNKMMQWDATKPPLFTFDRCPLNESSCYTSENSNVIVVTLYNPVAWSVKEPVRIPVKEGTYEVFAPNSDKIDSQLIEIPTDVINIPTRRSQATHEVVFIAHLKALKYKSFYIRKVTKTKRDVTLISPGSDRSREKYQSMNDYWQDFKEKVDIKNIEDLNDKPEEPKYENINEYWEDLKEKIDIRNIEVQAKPEEPNKLQDPNIAIDDDVLKDKDGIIQTPMNAEVGELDIMIKEAADKIVEDTRIREMVNLQNSNIDYDILKDKDVITPINDGVGELERMIKETREDIRKREMNAFSNLSDEEVRMLSDDPMVLEKLEDFYVLENENIQLHIDNTSGRIRRVLFPKSNTHWDFQYDYFYYPGCVGNNEIPENRSSGAYIFRPNATQPTPITPVASSTIFGNVVTELHQIFSDNVFVAIRLYAESQNIELDWVVGPIDIEDKVGKEIVVRYKTNMVSNGEFYTDSNGRQSLKRKLNLRPQYNVTLAEPVGGNYYPVTNEIYIENGTHKFSVITDRSEGGSSLAEGEIELMLHRRLLNDDAFGVGEALNETANGNGLVVRGTHIIMMYNKGEDEIKEKTDVIQMHLKPLVFVSDAGDMTLGDWLKLKNCFSFLKEDLPKGIHLLTLEPWGKKLLLRLENFLSASDNSSVEVDLKNILMNVNVKSVTETMLSANHDKSREQWKWKTDDDFSESFNKEYGSFKKVNKAKESEKRQDDGFKVKMAAKEIRTFIVDYELVNQNV